MCSHSFADICFDPQLFPSLLAVLHCFVVRHAATVLLMCTIRNADTTNAFVDLLKDKERNNDLRVTVSDFHWPSVDERLYPYSYDSNQPVICIQVSSVQRE